MLARKCDRCGKCYENYGEFKKDAEKEEFNSVRTSCVNNKDTGIYNREIFNLCPECRSSFIRWKRMDQNPDEPEPVEPPETETPEEPNATPNNTPVVNPPNKEVKQNG